MKKATKDRILYHLALMAESAELAGNNAKHPKRAETYLRAAEQHKQDAMDIIDTLIEL